MSPPPLLELYELLLAQDEEHAIVMLDPDGRIIGWNRGAEVVFGYAPQEVLGRESAVLFVPEDIAQNIPKFELDVARASRPAEDDRWMLRKDGVRFWATGMLTPLRDASGEIVAFGKVLRNRTDFKGRLEWLENSLSQQRRVNERKNVFISTLAHEVRGPLGAMSNALEVLNLIGSQNDDSLFARTSMQRQIGFIRRLVEDLLEVSRIGAGKVQLRKQEVSLHDIVRRALETCQPTLDQRTHEVEVVMAESPIVVHADADRLEQVFVNLIQNAAKYTQYGGNIWIKAFVEGADAIVKIEDTGIGISPEMMPRIFDLFAQAEFEPGEKREGLGLGLSIVHDLVTLHGGTVQVRSDGIGRGSEFTVRLPMSGNQDSSSDKAVPG